MFRYLLILIIIFILFIPIYGIMNVIYKKFFVYNDDELVNEFEKNKENNKKIKKEIEDKITNLKQEQEELNKIKEKE